MSTSSTARDLVALLRVEHDALARRCEAFGRLARTADWPRVQAQWRSLSLAIESRLACESLLLDDTVTPDPWRHRLAQRVEAEHAAMQVLLTDIGGQVAARAVRPAAIEVLLELLRDHGSLDETWLRPGPALRELEAAVAGLRSTASA